MVKWLLVILLDDIWRWIAFKTDVRTQKRQNLLTILAKATEMQDHNWIVFWTVYAVQPSKAAIFIEWY